MKLAYLSATDVCDACIIPVARRDGKAVALAEAGSETATLAAAWIADRRFKPEPGEAVFFPTWGRVPARHLLLAGVGDEPLSVSGIERAAAAAGRLARKNRLPDLAVDAAGLAGGGGPEAEQRMRAFVRGLRFGAYEYAEFRSETAVERPAIARLALAGLPRTASLRRVLEAAKTEADALDEIRDLANSPGNEAPPPRIAAAARALARREGFACRILGRAQLERQGCEALLAVGRGSRHDPCLIALEHRVGPRSARPVVLVGKTITFDSGGLSLKQAKGMDQMKHDKCGGMAVLAAMAVLARRGFPHPVVGILAVAENMPDGGATRPGDIVRSRSGRTIEIQNTDAEGRLVLADALSWAQRYRPSALVDLATLTGAVGVALGRHAAAVLGTDDALAGALRAAGERVGERLWPLPLWPEYDEDIKSTQADLKNLGDGSAGTIIGAAFLKNFVPAGVPWAHLDIAATAWDDKSRSWRSDGATLFGARLLVEWLESEHRPGKGMKREV